MADTASQGSITPKRTIQEVVDFQYGKAGGSLRSIIIRNRNGDCVIKPNTNIRFYNCTFTSFKSTDNNIFFFRNCSFKGESSNFSIENASVIADDGTSFESKFSFKNTSIQLLGAKISNTHEYENVQLLSMNSSWKATESKNAIVASNSRIISIKDTIENWSELFIKATNKTYIKIDRATNIVLGEKKGLLSLTDSSADIWNIDKFPSITGGSSPLITLVNSSIFMNSSTDIVTESPVFNATNSKITIEKFNKISSTKDTLFTLKDSVFIAKNLKELSCASSEGRIFSSTNYVDILLENVKELKSVGVMFDFEKANIRIYGDKTNVIQGQTNLIFTGTKESVIVIKNLDSITSSGSSLFNIIDSVVNISSIKNISGNSNQSYILKATRSNATFSDIQNIISAGDDLFRIENSSSLSLLDITKVNNSGRTAISLLSNSKLLSKNVGEIKGASIGIDLTASTAIVKNTNSISEIKGINSKCSLIDVDEVSKISGTDIVVNLATTTNGGSSSVNEITLSSTNDIKELLFKGPISIGKASFTNYIIRNTNVKWLSDVLLTNTFLVEDINSVFDNNISGSGSYINSIKSRFKNITLNSGSVVDLVKSAASKVDLSELSSFSSKASSNIGELRIKDTGASVTASAIGTVTQEGKSSFLGLGLNNKQLSFNNDSAITGVSFFTTSGGNLGLQADNEIISEANYIRENARAEIEEKAANKISSIVASSSIVVQPVQIEVTSVNLIKLVAITSITIDAATVNITGL